MPMALLETSIYVHPRFPVEFVFRMDDIPLRVAIEWEAIERLMGPASADVEQVRDYLHRHRSEFASAIRAQVAAHGTPLTRLLTMSSEDLRLVGEPGRLSGDDACGPCDDTAADARTGTGALAPPTRIASTQNPAALARPGEQVAPRASLSKRL